METQEIYSGRLIDHIQLVVKNLALSRQFYGAVFEVVDIPLGGEAESFFWFDELFVSTPDSAAATGVLTGRHHIAFQAKDTATVDAFYQSGLKVVAGKMARPANDNTIPATTPPSCFIQTETTSKPCSTAMRISVQHRSKSHSEPDQSNIARGRRRRSILFPLPREQASPDPAVRQGRG